MRSRTQVVGAMVAVLALGAGSMASGAGDEELFASSGCIVMGKLSGKVNKEGEGKFAAMLENVRPLLMRTHPSEGSGWPRASDDRGIYLHFTDADGFKAGDEGVWLLQSTKEGMSAHGAGRFRPAAEQKAVLESLAKWMDEQVSEKIDSALAALKKDLDGEAEETWKACRELVILWRCMQGYPLYDGRPNENPWRRHFARFVKALGWNMPVVPNPRTAEEVGRAIPVLNKQFYVRTTLDDRKNPKFAALFEQGLQSYWEVALSRVDHTLGANPVAFDGHIASMKSVGTKESNATLFPPGAKVTRMRMFKLGVGVAEDAIGK